MSWLSASHKAASSAFRTAAILAIVALSSAYPGVRSAYADVAIGASTGDFLSFEVGGRSAGMAGAHTPGAPGGTAPVWDPPGLSRPDQPQGGSMHAKRLR